MRDIWKRVRRRLSSIKILLWRSRRRQAIMNGSVVFFFRFQKTTTTNCLRCVTIIYDVLLTIPAHAPTVINETNRRGNDHLLPRNRCLNFDTRGSLKLRQRQRRRRPADISICTKFLCSYAMYRHSTQNTLYTILWYLYECNTYRRINKRSIIL